MTNLGEFAIINKLFGGTGVRQRIAKRFRKEIEKKDLTNNKKSDIIAKLLMRHGFEQSEYKKL